jgi:hypothetical protein
MCRLLTLTAALSLVLMTAVTAQSSAVAGRWDLAITGQAKRTLDLTVDGTVVSGTMTAGANTARVTGEFGTGTLVLGTPARDEYFTFGYRDGAWQGTYVYCGSGSPEECYKTGVTLSRPIAR